MEHLLPSTQVQFVGYCSLLKTEDVNLNGVTEANITHFLPPVTLTSKQKAIIQKVTTVFSVFQITRTNLKKSMQVLTTWSPDSAIAIGKGQDFILFPRVNTSSCYLWAAHLPE